MAESKSAVTKVTDYIKDKIIFKKLKVGDKIPSEAELCAILDVGRGSVREAVKVLESIDILNVRRGDGTYISDPENISFTESLLFKMILLNVDLSELVVFREQIEIAVMHLAIVNVTPETFSALKACNDEFTLIIREDPDNHEMLHALDEKFHRLLGACMQNKLMEEIYRLAFEMFSPTILENYMVGQVDMDRDLTIENHRLIVEAIEKRDVYTGIHAIKVSTKLWKKWAEKNQYKMNGKESAFTDYSATVDPTI